jgi:hypothetical protein
VCTAVSWDDDDLRCSDGNGLWLVRLHLTRYSEEKKTEKKTK